MNITWIGASESNYTKGRSRSINKVVLHWIVGTLESADATFNNPDRRASAHYGIGDDEIHQYVKENDTAWHAGNWTANQESIGIEHEGGWLQNDGTRFKPTQKTHETSALLVADICKRYNIPINRDHIRLHNEFRATQCPGSLDIDFIINLAKNQITPDPIEITNQTKIPQIGNKEVQQIKAEMEAKDRRIKELEDQHKPPDQSSDDETQQPYIPSNSISILLYNLAKSIDQE